SAKHRHGRRLGECAWNRREPQPGLRLPRRPRRRWWEGSRSSWAPSWQASWASPRPRRLLSWRLAFGPASSLPFFLLRLPPPRPWMRMPSRPGGERIPPDGASDAFAGVAGGAATLDPSRACSLQANVSDAQALMPGDRDSPRRISRRVDKKKGRLPDFETACRLEAQAYTADTKFCSNCGRAVVPGSRSCVSCGTRFDVGTHVAPTVTQAPSA